jgi:hypothetical protein
MCSRELGTEHDHLVESVAQKLICACDACAILFDGQSGSKYKRVPRRVLFMTDFELTDGQWDGLMVPIGMAFFFKSTSHNKIIALYPSPAGPIESSLSLDAWTDIVEANPVLNEMEDDVSALLVNRIGHARGVSAPEYYLVPIDECYKLVGLVRTHWRGLSGGTDIWREIGDFFCRLKEKAAFGREEIRA